MKLYDQLKKDVLIQMINEMKDHIDKGLNKEYPSTSDYCYNTFYCESELSEEQLKIFTEVYYESENFIHRTLDRYRENKKRK